MSLFVIAQLPAILFLACSLSIRRRRRVYAWKKTIRIRSTREKGKRIQRRIS